jgi:lambda family phage minor tail protein L
VSATGPLTYNPANERRRLSQDAIILLYRLDYSRLAGDEGNETFMFLFTDAVGSGGEAILLNGKLHVSMPIQFAGSRVIAQGAPPRPSIRIVEVVPGTFADLVRATDDLKGARLRRSRIYRKHLDDGDAPDPAAVWWPPEEWVVLRKLASDSRATEFLLGSKADLEDVVLPGGRIEHNRCPFVYGPLRGPLDPVLCTWTPDPVTGPFFKADDTATAVPAEDACGFRYQSCKLRFTAQKKPLDFGGYPAIQRIAQPASRS